MACWWISIPKKLADCRGKNKNYRLFLFSPYNYYYFKEQKNLLDLPICFWCDILTPIVFILLTSRFAPSTLPVTALVFLVTPTVPVNLFGGSRFEFKVLQVPEIKRNFRSPLTTQYIQTNHLSLDQRSRLFHSSLELDNC